MPVVSSSELSQRRQEILDGARRGGLRSDVEIGVIHTYLETVLDGFITRLASGAPMDDLEAVLHLVESSVRSQSSVE